jgi:RsiW-degrading membrane proteinase PrsW (M82 family)
MWFVISFALCFAPLLVLLPLCVRFVQGLKITQALLTVLLGLLALIPVVLLQFVIRPLPLFDSRHLLAILITALLLNGIIEESIKMLCVSFLPTTKAALPVCTASSAILGLTLGCFETVIYLAAGQQNILLRLCTAGVIHTLCAVLSGFTLWTLKHGRRRFMPFFYAVTVHGVHNFFAGFSGPLWWFSVAAICFGAIECRVWYQKLSTDGTG